MVEALADGDQQSAKDIAGDIQENLKKINHSNYFCFHNHQNPSSLYYYYFFIFLSILILFGELII